MTVKDGGSAFPEWKESMPGAITQLQRGMSLRDYFAAKVLQAIVSDSRNMAVAEEKKSGLAHEFIAEVSYRFADAMLKERDKS